MNTIAPSSTTLKINLPNGILANARAESIRIGVSVQDFVRTLLTTYFAHAPSIRAVSKGQVLYQDALSDLKNNHYQTVKKATELKTYLDSLD